MKKLKNLALAIWLEIKEFVGIFVLIGLPLFAVLALMNWLMEYHEGFKIFFGVIILWLVVWALIAMIVEFMSRIRVKYKLLNLADQEADDDE